MTKIKKFPRVECPKPFTLFEQILTLLNYTQRCLLSEITRCYLPLLLYQMQKIIRLDKAFSATFNIQKFMKETNLKRCASVYQTRKLSSDVIINMNMCMQLRKMKEVPRYSRVKSSERIIPRCYNKKNKEKEKHSMPPGIF